eukprot:COSAG02_NODE_129_length_34796_cov_26.576015_24_plen_53_part_00
MEQAMGLLYRDRWLRTTVPTDTVFVDQHACYRLCRVEWMANMVCVNQLAIET